jgi:hypothetical protein
MWYVNEYSTHLIGTKKLQKIDVPAIVKKFQDNEVLRNDYAEFDMYSPYQFIGQFWLTEDELADYVKGSKVNTDNYPLVEFSRVVNIAPVVNVMQYLIDHEIRYDSVLINLNQVMPAEKEMQQIRQYAINEKSRMQSIANVAKSYLKKMRH